MMKMTMESRSLFLLWLGCVVFLAGTDASAAPRLQANQLQQAISQPIHALPSTNSISVLKQYSNNEHNHLDRDRSRNKRRSTDLQTFKNHKPRQSLQHNPVAGYQYLGCYVPAPYTYPLNTGSSLSDSIVQQYIAATMTPLFCSYQCITPAQAGITNTMFAVAQGNQCFCGVKLNEGQFVDEKFCDTQCFGDDRETCGGSKAVSVWRKAESGGGPSGGQAGDDVGVYKYYGCLDPSTITERTLSNAVLVQGNMTAAICQSFCYNYIYDNTNPGGKAYYAFFGIQNGTTCRCGNSLARESLSPNNNNSTCNIPCPGSPASVKQEYCGGTTAITAYSRLTQHPGAYGWRDELGQYGYEYIGCYVFDNNTNQNGRGNVMKTFSDPWMSPRVCRQKCYEYNNHENPPAIAMNTPTTCQCLSSWSPPILRAANDGECLETCPSLSNNCGGTSRARIYLLTTHPSILPNSPSQTPGYASIGCWQYKLEPALNRVWTTSPDMSVAWCMRYCSEHQQVGVLNTFFGVENGQTCRCSNKIDDGSVRVVDAGVCGVPCQGNLFDKCGGVNGYINIYSSVNNTVSASTVKTSVSTVPDVVASSTNTQIEPSPITTTLPTVPTMLAKTGIYQSLGCYELYTPFHGAGRASLISDDMTPTKCRFFCSITLSYFMFAVHNSTTCFCGNELNVFGRLTSANTCNARCAGDANQACGSGTAMIVYSQAPLLLSGQSVYEPNVLGVDGYKYRGCFDGGVVAGPVTTYTGNVTTVWWCLKRCKLAQSKGFGILNGDSCVCTLNVDNLRLGTGKVDDRECSVPCLGSARQLCGGRSKFAVYAMDDLISTINTPSTTQKPTTPSTTTPSNTVSIDPFISSAFSFCSNSTLCSRCQAQYNTYLSTSALTPTTQYTYTVLPRDTFCAQEFTTTDVLTEDSDILSRCLVTQYTWPVYSGPLTDRPGYDPSLAYVGHASEDCCGDCTVWADQASVVYFPENFTEKTLQVDGFTLTSPSVYLQFRTLYAQNMCSTLGEPIPYTLIPIPPNVLQTVNIDDIVCQRGTTISTGLLQTQSLHSIQSFCDNVVWDGIPTNNYQHYENPAYLSSLSSSLSLLPNNTTNTCTAMQQIFDLAYQHCHNQIIVPEQIYSNIRPEWKTCVRARNGLAFDPPVPVTSGLGKKRGPKNGGRMMNRRHADVPMVVTVDSSGSNKERRGERTAVPGAQPTLMNIVQTRRV